MTDKMKFVLLSVIAILAYVSLSFELIVLRQLINFVGSNTLVTSIVMSVILLFLSVGYYIGSVVKFNKVCIRRSFNKLFLSIAILYILACCYDVVGAVIVGVCNLGVTSFIWQVFIYSFLFLVYPSIALGFITSVIGRFVHRFDTNYTGRFMAVDTLGSVGGSLLTTLLFMPLIGVGNTIVVLVLLLMIAFVLIDKRKDGIADVGTALMFVLASFFVNNFQEFDDVKLLKDDAVARVSVIDNSEHEKSISLSVNGSNSSKIAEDRSLMFPYVKFINKYLIGNLDKTKVNDILVLGAGGFTIGIDDKHNNYVYLDVIGDLDKLMEDNFLHEKLSQNKKYIAKDAYLYIIQDKNKYDLIVVDVYSAMHSIPVNFVTTDFFEMVKNHLKENGMMVANIITSPFFGNNYSKRVDNTLRYVFKNNLTREIIAETVDFSGDDMANVLYIYRSTDNDGKIYTQNSNTAVWND